MRTHDWANLSMRSAATGGLERRKTGKSKFTEYRSPLCYSAKPSKKWRRHRTSQLPPLPIVFPGGGPHESVSNKLKMDRSRLFATILTIGTIPPGRAPALNEKKKKKKKKNKKKTLKAGCLKKKTIYGETVLLKECGMRSMILLLMRRRLNT